MDSRVVELIDSVKICLASGEIEIKPLRDRIVSLHGDVDVEADKVTLIQLYHAIIDCAARNVLASGGDVQPLQDLRKSEERFFLMKEAMVGDNVDPDRLAYLTQREILAGRMTPDDDFHNFAVAGSEVMGKGPASASGSKGGFWNALFRRR